MNDLKPPETTQKLSETTRNQPCYSFFNLKKVIHRLGCPNTPTISVLGQIWSQKLKFSKVTETWYSSTLLYPYFEFDVCFFYLK